VPGAILDIEVSKYSADHYRVTASFILNTTDNRGENDLKRVALADSTFHNREVLGIFHSNQRRHLMRLSVAKNVGLFVLAVLGIASRSNAGIITVPPGLSPGSQYRLVFVTADPYNPTSSNIADYNTRVNNEANNLDGDTGSLLAGLDATWFAIASTPTVNAIDNIGEDPGVPIYDLFGDLIAFDAEPGRGGIFDPGTIATPIYDALGIQVSERGTVCPNGFAWTGTQPMSGLGMPGDTLGSPDVIVYGLCDVGEQPAIDYNVVDYRPYSLYAVSDVLTAQTPESPTWVMLIAGGALILVLRRLAIFLAPRLTRTP
jgi:hypothetical protein